MSTIAIDVVATALAELLSQFDDAEALRALLTALVTPLQSLEDDSCYLIESALLSNAIGAYLDRYGKIVDIDRGGRSDDDYRALIQTSVSSNDSSGTIEAVLQIVAILADSVQVKYDPLYPACFQLQVTTLAPLTAEQISDIDKAMNDIVPAGVCWNVIEATPDAFTFDIGPGFDEGGYSRVISQGN